MNSFNHYAYGAIGNWMYSQVAGIQKDPVIPAYRKIIIRPVTGGGLTWVRASHESIYGTIWSEWKKNNGSFSLITTIPANTEAEIYIPAKDPQRITENGKPVSEVPGLKFLRIDKGFAVFSAGSGTYDFAFDGSSL
jgi:alpha-L-rhamnosidase